MRLFSAERLWDPAVQNSIEFFDRKIKRRWELDDEADIQQAVPTFPVFDPDLVMRENDEELGPMTDGPPNPDSFTLEEYDQFILTQIKMPLSDKEFIATVKQKKRNINVKPVGISIDNPPSRHKAIRS